MLQSQGAQPLPARIIGDIVGYHQLPAMDRSAARAGGWAYIEVL